MKITHVTQNYYPSRGGTQYLIQKISEYLAENFNDEVEVLTTNSYYGPNRNEFKKIEEETEHINDVLVKRYGFFRYHRPLLQYSMKAWARMSRKEFPETLERLNIGPYSPSLKRALKDCDADIICASSVHYMFADYARWNLPNRKPFILHGAIHIREQESMPAIYLKRVLSADYYIANTVFEKEVLVNNNVPEEKIRVIGTATDIFKHAAELDNEDSLKAKYKIDVNANVLIYLGRHEASKNIDCLLKAYQLIKEHDPKVQLIIAGAKGSYTSYLEDLLKTDQQLHIYTDITELEKCELLKLSDMMILPSSEESFGIVFLEAWSYRKPVIGAGIGAISALISDGKDGLLFKPGDHLDLAEKIKALLANKSQTLIMGEEGYKKVMQHFTWSQIAAKFRETYEMAIESFQKKIKR